MSDLFEDESPNTNAPELSVSDLSGAIKRTLEGAFGRVRVRGEIGRVMHARSGHYYYDLKDDKNVISCNTWKGQASRLSVLPEEGLEVIVTGRLSTFGPQSRYNLNVEEIEISGEGALMAMLEKRKKALAAEGIFDLEHKQPLPFLPTVIGVVTSPSGAVIRDILHRLRERFPRHVLIWPAAVQGQNCAPEVVRGIEGFNALPEGGQVPRPDLIIVARGGGSTEDLWGFNEEAVVRAAFASKIPLISAVGHETDTTLIDFASDKRAPTPTAAAEMAVPVRRELWVQIQDQGQRVLRAVDGGVERRRQRLSDVARALPKPEQALEGPAQRLDQLELRFTQALRRGMEHRAMRLTEVGAGLRPSALMSILRHKGERLRSLRLSPAQFERQTAKAQRELGQLSERFARAVKAEGARAQARFEARVSTLNALSYQQVLERGYAVVRDAQGQLVTSAKDAAKMAEVQFSDGRVALSKPSARKASEEPPEQGSLF